MSFVKKPSRGSATYFKFSKIGDKLTGVYLGATYNPQGKYGPEDVHLFQNERDGYVQVSMKRRRDGKPAILTEDLRGEEGNRLEVIFFDTKDTGKGHPMKLYSVGVDSDFERLSSEMLVSAVDESNQVASYEGDEESYLGEDEPEQEEVEDEEAPEPLPARASAPSAERQARVQALLKKKTKSA